MIQPELKTTGLAGCGGTCLVHPSTWEEEARGSRGGDQSQLCSETLSQKKKTKKQKIKQNKKTCGLCALLPTFKYGINIMSSSYFPMAEIGIRLGRTKSHNGWKHWNFINGVNLLLRYKQIFLKLVTNITLKKYYSFKKHRKTSYNFIMLILLA
jgi:hypothetical protein